MVLLNAGQLPLEDVCLQIEQQTGKRISPWHKAKHSFRLSYMRAVIADDQFVGTLAYRVFQQPAKSFLDIYTLQALASSIGTKLGNVTSVKEIYVDGLTCSMQSVYGVELRRMGGQRASFHRATDQGSPFIRLADALAGLVREAEQDEASESARILRQGKAAGVIRETPWKRKTTRRWFSDAAYSQTEFELTRHTVGLSAATEYYYSVK